MNLFFSIIFLVISLYAIVAKKYKLALVISILSVIIDTFALNVGVNFLLIYVVGYGFLFTNFRYVFNTLRNTYLKPFVFEFYILIILAIIYGFISPWPDLTGTRPWTQTSPGRSLITIFRLIGDFSIIAFLIFVLSTKRVSVRFLFLTVAIISALSMWVGLLDYFTGYILHDLIFDLEHIERSRFIGMNGEPKVLGRIGALCFTLVLIFLIYTPKKSFIFYFSLISNFLAVVMSSSASSIVLFFLLMFFIFFKFSVKNLFLFCFLASIFFIAINFIPFVEQGTFDKINKALYGVDDLWLVGELAFFTRFDIFDRLALIFLWENPFYMISGVGPNLISIPASQYIPPVSIFYELGRIDSVPNVMPINLLSRSGILGVLLYLFGFRRLFSALNVLPSFVKSILIAFILFSMVYLSVVVFVGLGVVIGLIELDRLNKLKVINSKMLYN